MDCFLSNMLMSGLYRFLHVCMDRSLNCGYTVDFTNRLYVTNFCWSWQKEWVRVNQQQGFLPALLSNFPFCPLQFLLVFSVEFLTLIIYYWASLLSSVLEDEVVRELLCQKFSFTRRLLSAKWHKCSFLFVPNKVLIFTVSTKTFLGVNIVHPSVIIIMSVSVWGVFRHIVTTRSILRQEKAIAPLSEKNWVKRKCWPVYTFIYCWNRKTPKE